MEQISWFLNEIEHAGQEHLDSSYVPDYDRKAGTDPSEDVNLLKSIGLCKDHTVIDFGAGTGTFALAVAPYCQTVIAVDVSPNMLQQLQVKAKNSGFSNIKLVQRGFLSYESQKEIADFVYSRNALHHLPDFWKVMAFKKIYSALKSKGYFIFRDLIFSCQSSEIDSVIEHWLETASERPESGWTRPELETHLREEHSTFSWLLEPMLKNAGFQIQENTHVKSQVRSMYVCQKI